MTGKGAYAGQLPSVTLASALSVEPLLLDADHEACSTHPQQFVQVLLGALAAVRP